MGLTLKGALEAIATLEEARAVLEQELRDQSRLAHAGEVAGVVLHEFNNFLNTLTLDVAVLETKLPEGSANDLAEIGQQVGQITSLIRQFQQYRQQQRPDSQLLDVNEIISEVVDSMGHLGTVDWQSDAGLLRVRGAAVDLKRLFHFLLKNAVAATGAEPGSVTIRAAESGEKILVHIEDVGPSIAPEFLPGVFEPQGCRPQTNCLELATSKTLAQRLHGRVRAANRPEGGLLITVELPAAIA
jgi:C4-dicarboxylate-specific signal transduction histidine kinase